MKHVIWPLKELVGLLILTSEHWKTLVFLSLQMTQHTNTIRLRNPRLSALAVPALIVPTTTEAPRCYKCSQLAGCGEAFNFLPQGNLVPYALTEAALSEMIPTAQCASVSFVAIPWQLAYLPIKFLSWTASQMKNLHSGGAHAFHIIVLKFLKVEPMNCAASTRWHLEHPPSAAPGQPLSIAAPAEKLGCWTSKSRMQLPYLLQYTVLPFLLEIVKTCRAKSLDLSPCVICS